MHGLDDLDAHGVQRLGGVRHGRVVPGEHLVHVLPVGQMAQTGMIVVARGGQHIGSQSVAVGGDGGADLFVDDRGHLPGELLVLGLVGPGQSARVGVAHDQVELSGRGRDQPGHRGPPSAYPFHVSFGCRREEDGEPTQASQVALSPPGGVQRHLGQEGQDRRDGSDEGAADGELGQRDLGRAGHAARQLPYEVERLVLGLAETLVRQPGGALGDGREPRRDRALRLRRSGPGAGRRNRGTRRESPRAGRRRGWPRAARRRDRPRALIGRYRRRPASVRPCRTRVLSPPAPTSPVPPESTPTTSRRPRRQRRSRREFEMGSGAVATTRLECCPSCAPRQWCRRRVIDSPRKFEGGQGSPLRSETGAGCARRSPR